MKKINVHQIDAFAEAIFGGNPAGVVTNAEILTDGEMQNIAREMNLSETAFMLPATSNDADLKLRFFTPAQEVPFCGHATVGALFQLALNTASKLSAPHQHTVRIETGAGILPAVITATETKPQIAFGAPNVEISPYRLQGEAFAKPLGVPAGLIAPDATILLDKKLNYIYIPTMSLTKLSSQTFNFDHIREQFGKENIIVFCLFTNETVSGESHLHARGLAPIIGINEDPFTGSMQAGLVAAAKHNGYIDANIEEIITEQGNFIGRPGKAKVTHNITTDEFTVAASATHVFSSTWRI